MKRSFFMCNGPAGIVFLGAAMLLGMPGASRAAVQLGESMDSGLASAYTTGEQTLTSGVWYTTAVYQEAAAASYGASGAAARLNDDTSGAGIRTPALDTVGSVTFWYRELNSGGGDFILQKSYDDSTWVDVATQAFSGTTFVQYSNDVNDAASTIYLRVLSDDQAGHLIVDEFEITSYENESSAPVFDANPGPISATVGVAEAFTVSATGSPEPELALAGTTASGGYSFTAGTGELSYTPSTNDIGTQTFTFTAGNSVGTATQEVSVTVGNAPESAPVFNANPGPIGATVEVAVAFTVSANGNPLPDLALDAATASGGYSFTVGTGELNYTPPTNDVGAQTFTFSATNTQGTAMQTVTVNVASAPVFVPTVTVTNLGSNSFTINWTAVTDATNYQVQVATDTNFTEGASSGGLIISEVADPFDDANARFVELYNASGAAIDFGTATWTLCRQANGSTWASISLTGTLAADAAYVVAYNQSTYESVFGDTADLYDGSVSGNGNDGYFLYSGGDYSSGTLVDAYGVVDQDGSGYDWEYLDSHAVRDSAITMPTSTWTSSEWTITEDYATNMTPHSHTVTGGGGGEGGTIVFDGTVAALTTNVSGLEMETTYYVRVRSGSTGTWSTVVLATTTGGEPTVPSFTGGTGPYSTAAGELLDFTVSAMGTPAPTLALESATANTNDYAFEPSTGYFLYQPPTNDVGEQTFTFTASNSEGVAGMVVTVTVTAVTAPVFGTNPGPLGATSGVERAFTVSATGAPDPVLALQGTTASSGYSFTASTGVLDYTAPTNDVGTQTFTFTASNVAGIVTQAVEVTVVLPPAIPTLDAVGPLYLASGDTSNLWVVAHETDGDVITLYAENLPDNASFTTTNGTGSVSNLFTFSPSTNQAGEAYTVYFYAGDIHGTNWTALTINVASDDPWADYYAPCYSNGVLLTGTALKNALHDIIDDHTSYSYDDVWEILQDIDECPTNSSMVQLLYLQYGRDKDNNGGGTGQWNREHVWANSHGINDTLPGYTDAHHLHPTDVTVNSTRGNLDFDTVSGTSDSYSYSSTAFEPPDAGKGDVARAMFYMAVRYDGTDGVGDLELTNDIPTSTSSSLFGKLDTLLDWNELDDVNDYEIIRNNKVYTNWQGNRNPFVDHPEWARVIFDTNYVAIPAAPAAFGATANGQTQIDLSFTWNGTGDDVIIVWNSTGSFSTPSGTAPAVGQSFAGGTVLYKGASSPQSHTGLSSCQEVFYKCWSYSGTNYSVAGLTDSATTAAPDAPAMPWAGSTNATDFTAVWSAVSGVTNYILSVATGPGFTGIDDAWSEIFRETMGTSSGTITLSEHEAADGFDNDAYTMSYGGADYPADIRSSSASDGYADPAGNAASSNANVYFTSTGYTNLGFAIDGIDTTGYEALSLSFGYRKEDASTNMSLSVDWSTNSWDSWSSVTISNLPSEDAATGWYMISNLAVSASALDSTNLTLRWMKNGGVAGRVDDILLRGYTSPALFVPGYSNLTVMGSTSAVVTGLVSGTTYYFRVASEPNCTGNYSPVASVTTLETLEAPAFGANPGPFVTTTGVEVAFGVTAGGSPTPALALDFTTASSGYSFDSGTGQLAYTPPYADIGAQTFTFTAGNSQGVATQVVSVTVDDWPAEAPAFTSGSAYGATTSVAMAFTVTASGYPVPTLALTGATASSGYSFDSGTGVLDYTPPEADVGSPAFTFTASNASGVATQVVVVAVDAGIPDAPAALWAGSTNVTGFTAEWSSVGIATGYWLDVSTEADFLVTGGDSVQTILASNAATSAALITNEWSGTDISGDLYVVMTQSTAEVVSPAFSTVGQTNLVVGFEARTYGGTSSSNITVSISTNNGTDWTVLSVVNPTNGSSWGSIPELVDADNLGHDQTRIRWQSLDAASSVGVGIRSLLVSGWAPGTVPEYVAGYSNLPVAGTSQAVTGLVADSTWYFRVRAGNAAGISADSSTASVTTKQKSDQTISFPAISAQITTNEVGLSATAFSGLEVSFAVLSGPASIASGTNLSFTGAGDVFIVASQAGNELWNAAPDVTNVFTVSKAVAVVTLDNLAQTYDGAGKAVAAGTTPTGLAVTVTYEGSAISPTNAGSYAVTGTIDDVMYQGSASDTLVISKASATVTLESLAQVYDGSSKSATATTAPAGLTVDFTYDGSATAPTAAGTYSVTGTVNDLNYIGSAVDVLVISKATATVNLGNLAQTFDGTDRIATATTVPAGLTVDITYDGSATAPTNAGSYAVTGTVNDVNYDGSISDTLVVSKASATVTLGDLAQTFDGTDRIATATTVPAGLTVDITYDASATAPTNAGSYAVTGTVNDVNYDGLASDMLVVSKASATVNLGGLAQTFDGTDRIATATTVPAGLTVDITYNGSATAPTDAGSYAVTGTVNDVNYTGSGSDTLVVGKATATVTLGDLAQTYDGSDRIATATTVPAGLTVDITYDGSATAPTDAGSYAVTGTVNDVNYTGSGSDTLVVSKATATVTLDNLAQTFDGTERIATATTVPAGLTVDITYDGGATAPTNAGSYAVTGTINDVNYIGSSSDTLVVSKATATVTLGDLAQTFDGTDRIVTVTTVPVGLTVDITYNGDATAPTNAGSYAVTGMVNDVNYTGSISDTLVVSKATATVTLGDLAQTYDGTERIVTATTVPAGLSVDVTYDGSSTAPVGAGSYAVTGTVNDVNYDGSAGDSLVVSKADQTISFDSIADQLATNEVTLSASADSGLDVSFSVASGPASIAGGTQLTFSGAGSVSIVASQAGNDNWNAAGNETNSFTVSKAGASVILGNLTQAYDGTARGVSVTTVPAGLAVDVTYGGNSWAPTNAGSYAVEAVINESLYQGSSTGLLVVSQATNAAVVTLGSLAQTYDGTPRVVTATTEPEGLTVEITYNGSLTVPTDAGSYVVTGMVQDINYTGSASGLLVVSKATATVTLDDLALTYDGTDRMATATTVPEGLTVEFTYDGIPAAPTNAGSYAVTGTVNDVNYDGSTSDTLVVSKAMATVTLGDLVQTYDGTSRIVTATTVPEGLAVYITYDGSATAPTNAGSYAVTGMVSDVNYDGISSDMLVVSKATAIVTLSDLTQTADGSPKTVSAVTDPVGLTVEMTYDGSSVAPSNAGSYAVTGTVNEVNYEGSAAGTFVLEAALTDFEQWLDDQSLDYQDARYEEDADDDGDGMTTWEEYLADTMPDDSNSVLVLTTVYVNAGDAGEATGQLRLAFPASSNRYYLLEYCTDLENNVTGTTDLGWGVPGMVITNKSEGTWYGVIRSHLSPP